MITHVFNSSVVSGPEMLVIPALKKLEQPTSIVFLTEERLKEQSKRPIEYAQSFGHQVFSVPVRGRWDAQAFKSLRGLLDQISPSIVHAHDVKASLYTLKAKQVSPRFSGKLISTHHGAAYRKGKIRLYEEFYVRWILPQYDRVLCVCQGDQRSIVRRGVEPQKVSIHLNGADRKRVDPTERVEQSEAIRNRWRLSNSKIPASYDAIFLGAVARLSPEKRHDRMIGFLAELKKLGFKRRVVLLCFGEGQELEHLKRLAQALKVSDDVFWMGYSKSIAEEMAGLDLILSVSDGEGIPVSLIEAGWAATPAFVTEVGGIPDLISGPEFGFMVSPRDDISQMSKHLKTVLENTHRMKEVGQMFQKRVEAQFSERAWLSQLNEVYRSL